MVMESEMPLAAQLILGRLVPALLAPFSFGLDIHALALRLLQGQGLLQGDVHLAIGLGVGSDTACCHLLCL